MSELIAPRLIGENDLINKYGKRVVQRNFVLPDETVTEYLVWGGTVVPSIVFPMIETDDGFSVIAVRQFRYGANEFIIEIPGGCPKPGQTLEDVAYTELLEETGYVAERIIRLGAASLWFEPAAGITDYVPFLALRCKKVADPKPDADEILEVHVIPLDTWKRMIKNGEIRDTKTIALTMLALLFLE